MATLNAEDFLSRAWQLIEKAREHVLRQQTDEEYLVALGGSPEAAKEVLGRKLSASRVRFAKLCDSERKGGGTDLIKLPDAGTGETIEVEWRVYRGEGGERAFDNLFWSYWNATSIIKDEDEREQDGRKVLASWKRDGVPGNDFLAFARFRRERDNRIENLQKKPDRSPSQQLPAP